MIDEVQKGVQLGDFGWLLFLDTFMEKPKNRCTYHWIWFISISLYQRLNSITKFSGIIYTLCMNSCNYVPLKTTNLTKQREEEYGYVL